MIWLVISVSWWYLGPKYYVERNYQLLNIFYHWQMWHSTFVFSFHCYLADFLCIYKGWSIHRKVLLTEMAATHWPSASLKWSVIDWNHAIGSVVLKDSPYDVVTSWLIGSGATLNISLTSVSGNMGCACICVGISHPKSSILLGLSLNLAALPNCL